MELLHKNYATQLDEKANKYINFSIDATRRMTILINDLLEYAKIGADETLFEHIDTKSLMEEIIPLYQVELDLKEGSLILENLPDILGQKTPIKMLFQNLMGNAIKYQRADNPPLIKISGRESDDSWGFCVEDNGIGIPSQYFEEIFLMFKRLHTKEIYAGTGMGLATCKKIVTRHGG